MVVQSAAGPTRREGFELLEAPGHLGVEVALAARVREATQSQDVAIGDRLTAQVDGFHAHVHPRVRRLKPPIAPCLNVRLAKADLEHRREPPVRLIRNLTRPTRSQSSQRVSTKPVGSITEAESSSAGQASSPENEEPQKPNVVFMRRITSGNELYGMIGGADAYRLQNDELDTAEEVELVGSFLQDVRDYGDVGDTEPMEKVAQGHRFTQMIDELDGHGLWVFAGRTKARYRLAIADGQAFTCAVVNVLVLRSTNPTIIKKPPATEVVAVIIDA
jgi:hypothetical protein